MILFKITLYSVKLNILRSKQQQHISSRNTLLPWPPSEHSRNCPPIGQSQSHVTKPDPPVFSQTLIGNSWEEGPKICKLFAQILSEWNFADLTIVWRRCWVIFSTIYKDSFYRLFKFCPFLSKHKVIIISWLYSLSWIRNRDSINNTQ